ncbi:hypothetical protein [Nonlabens ulvanivorans]|uniref:Uncharacterized protein n=1 Tax=Nonlabens ulvanivorans TaxID=906888 RepID=A0A084JVF5_NONUL|nr:hypothetical protein [Nonlabens ulvanivorans]KEZ92939.1 hypothetical protein IL45_12490 [Nonlabens ulvanivorans]PRX12831.1 hypothetical protein LY02_02483 [Nonlabens ulvanivorans]
MKKRILSTIAVAGLLSLNAVNAQTYEPLPGVNKGTITNVNGIADDLKNEGIVGVGSWSSFNTLSNHMYLLEGANLKQTKMLVSKMGTNIMMLDDTIPSWVDTEAIREDVADVQKEFKELIATKTDNDEYMEDLEELTEQYEDLREELKEVTMEYIETLDEANEERKDQLEKGNYEKAQEKYQKEIQELNNISENK